MKLLSYAPDADPTEDGILTDCDHVVPSFRGIRAAPAALDSNVATATAVAVLGAASLVKIDETSRTFQGTANKLWELGGTTWSDVTRVAGTYTTVTNRWRFAQYGNVSLAASKQNVLQASLTSGAFHDVTAGAVAAPQADIVETVNDFIFLADTSNGPVYSSDEPDRWWCSALGDYTSWTPDIGTQCVTGRLTAVPGKITAARKFGDQIVMYKRRGMFLGSYVGPPIIWAFQQIPAFTGTFCQESVLNIGTPEQPLHFFVGENDFYLFDGARPYPIGNGVRERFLADLNTDEADQIILLHNRRQALIYIYYPRGGGTSLNSCLVYNYRQKRWGVDNRAIEFAFEYIDPGITYDQLTSPLYTTYDALPNMSYDEAFQSSREIHPAVFNTERKLQTLTGVAGSSTLTTGDLGDDAIMTCLRRLRPRFLRPPTAATLQNYYRYVLTDTPTLDTSTQLGEGRFDVLRAARWHRFNLVLTGDWELNEMKTDVQMDGFE